MPFFRLRVAGPRKCAAGRGFRPCGGGGFLCGDSSLLPLNPVMHRYRVKLLTRYSAEFTCPINSLQPFASPIQRVCVSETASRRLRSPLPVSPFHRTPVALPTRGRLRVTVPTSRGLHGIPWDVTVPTTRCRRSPRPPSPFQRLHGPFQALGGRRWDQIFVGTVTKPQSLVDSSPGRRRNAGECRARAPGFVRGFGDIARRGNRGRTAGIRWNGDIGDRAAGSRRYRYDGPATAPAATLFVGSVT